MSSRLSGNAEVEDVYSDLYSAFSQLTDTTARDIDHRHYSLTWKTLNIYLGASIGGLLFGYDTGVIAGVLLGLKPGDLGLDILQDHQKEVITGVTGIGSVMGSMVAFKLANCLGRRLTLGLCSVVFTLAAALMALALSFRALVAGRLIVGVAIGIAAQCVPLYLSEISPSSRRGTILAFNTSAITGGQLLASLIAWAIIDKPNSWRYLFGASAIPSLLLLFTLKFIPESPRWLLLTEQPQRAREAIETMYPEASELEINDKLTKMGRDLTKLRKYQDENQPLLSRRPEASRRYNSGSSSDNIAMARDFTHSIRSNNRRGLKIKHKLEPRTRRALLVGCLLMFFQQATGFNAFIYYSPVILLRIGVSDPLLPAIGIAFVNFAFTGVAMKVVDHYGRRTALLYTVWIMTVGLIVGSAGLQYNNSSLFLGSLLVFIAGYAAGIGSVPWMSVEFLPLNQRSFGASCIACTNWFTNFAVSISFLSMIRIIGGEASMLIFAAMSALGWLFVYFWYPEVKGLSLEEIGQVFETGVDVHYVYRKYH